MSPQVTDRLPDITFSEPTEEEADQLELFFSHDKEVTGADFRRLFAETEPEPLFAYDLPHESIADDVRISAPKMKSKSAVNGNTYASFGDEGTTATVNAYGNLMQISRSLGYGSSGLFSVDTEGICGPTSSQSRLEQLMQLAKNPEGGIRLEVDSFAEEEASFMREKPKMEFISNRWPRFTPQSNLNPKEFNPLQKPKENDGTAPRSSSVQYFCQKGVVFQKYTFIHDPKSRSALHRSFLFIRQNFLIRTLDFVKGSNFNETDARSGNYAILPGPRNLSYVLAHKLTQSDAEEIGISIEEYKKDEGPKAVALVVTAFVNGKIQALNPSDSDVSLKLSDEARKEVSVSETVDIIIAYRLQLLPNKPRWKQSFVPASSLASMRTTLEGNRGVSYQNIRWSSNKHMNFIAGRNLEHILSVCSMPVPKSSSLVDGKVEMDASSLALTCGDMSGHRVATSATFFAFQLLLESLKYLCDRSKEPRDYLLVPRSCTCKIKNRKTCRICRICRKTGAYVLDLQTRILKTLEAHLSWTTKAKEAEKSDFTHHWITGKGIVDMNGPSCFSSSSLMDLSFKIIKSHDLHHFYKTHEEPATNLERWGLKSPDKQHMEIMRDSSQHKILEDRLAASISSLVRRLYEGDKRCQYTFSRPRKYPRKDEVKKYHLADHVWICRAIRCVEALRLEEHLKLEDGLHYLQYPRSDENDTKKQAEDQEKGQQQEGHRSEELQRVILKRFTTRNPQSQQRTIATSRTPTESRFLFHAQDTALFYAMDQGFFDLQKKTNGRHTNWTNKIPAWKETVEVQAEHEETQALDWEKPLWFALALIISSRRKRINKTPADEMLHQCSNILLRLPSSSGLFPGLLDEKRNPITFEDDIHRDKYWHATFEIPFALWVYGRAHLEVSQELEKHGTLGKYERGKGPAKDTSQLRQPMMKKTEFAAFNNLIDQSRLVEVSDDWLREVPSLLDFGFNITNNAAEARSPLALEHAFKKVFRHGPDFQSPEKEAAVNGAVFDVRKDSPRQESDELVLNLQMGLQSNTEIEKVLRGKRTMHEAKKRLIWLPRADKDTARTCFRASPAMEQDNLLAFFDRHIAYEKHFSDSTSAAMNEWATELHLSFFRKADWDHKKPEILESNFIPQMSCILIDPQHVSGQLSHNSEGTKIVRSVMSFRFVGDLFDRYWTCHFLECDPVKDQLHEGKFRTLGSRLSGLGCKSVKDMKHPGKMRKPWQQRKVLELLLFDYILTEIHESTDKLLQWVRDEVLEKDRTSGLYGMDMLSIIGLSFEVRATEPPNPLAESLQAGVQSFIDKGSAGYFSIVERWRFFQQVLEAMEEDLNGNLETISFWASREKDREPERPRWTRHDELTYRQRINQLNVMNQRNIRKLESLRAAIRAFRDSLTGKLETMRSDLEYQDSESINLFTYVTVVFLPLGFATGIFSMSGPPDLSTLVNMIELSLIAMAITLFALSNAKTTGRTIVHPIILTFQYINNCLLDPLLRPFCWLGNILLHFGIILEFRLLKWFLQFMVYPIIDLLDKGAKSLIPEWNPELLRKKYQKLVHSNQQVIAKRRDRNPGKAAREGIQSQKSSKKKDDEERGGSQSDSSGLKDA